MRTNRNRIGHPRPCDPMIAFLEARRAGLFAWEHIGRNVLAGIIVGIVALPLALVVAVNAGVILVYRIEGPFFFGAAEKLERTLERVQLDIRTVVIRLGRVPFIDAT